MSKRNPPNNKAALLARDKRVLAGFSEHFKRSDALVLNGTSYKVQELTQMLSDRGDAAAAADAVRAKWQTAVAAAEEKNHEVTTMMVALRQHLLSQYGTGSQVAVDFGFSTKRKTPTVQTKAEANAKRRATRQAKTAKAQPSGSNNGASPLAPSNDTAPAPPSAEPKPTS